MTAPAPLAVPLRYLVGGIACAILHNVIVIGCASIGFHYVPALVLSFVLVTPTGYLLHSLYTFRCALSWPQFGRFLLGNATGFPVSLVIMLILCSFLRVPVAIATPIATALLFLFNYLCARWAIPLWRQAASRYAPS